MMKTLLLALLIGQVPSAQAVIDGPTTVPAGSVVFLNGLRSQSATPLVWSVTPEIPFITLDKGGRPDVFLLLPQPPPGTYRVTLIAGRPASLPLSEVVLDADKDEKDLSKVDVDPDKVRDAIDSRVASTAVEVTVTPLAPVPPPTPPVPPTPGPNPPGPNPPSPPLPGEGLRVLIVFESGDVSKLPSGQLATIYGRKLREYLDTHCATGPDGKTKEWRIYDADVDVSGESPAWQAAMKVARTSLPWIVISNGARGSYAGPLPADADQTIALISKYAS